MEINMEKEYNLLNQVAVELQIAWLNDAFGQQIPVSQVEEIAQSTIDKRKDELRG